MTDRATAEWDRRFEEGHVRLDRNVEPRICADRYDVHARETIVDLTNRALFEMFDAGYGRLAIDDLDLAAEELGVSVDG